MGAKRNLAKKNKVATSPEHNTTNLLLPLGTAVPEGSTKSTCKKKFKNKSVVEGRACQEIVECMFPQQVHGTHQREGEGRILAKGRLKKRNCNTMASTGIKRNCGRDSA